jgi:Swi5-dependent recombination DNA repair protein 1
MSEVGPPFKRRRIEGAVQKPFKSPMRTPFKPNSNPPAKTPLISQSPLQKSVTSAGDDDEDTENRVENRAIAVTSTQTPQTTSGVRSIGRPSRIQTPQSSQNPQLKATRDLESKVRLIRRENEQLRQALTILDSSKDTELENLIVKWRSAARLAAEEVYGSARDKVNRMGGVEGLREQERQTKELRQQWEDEDREYQVEKRIKEFKKMVEEGEATEEDLERFIMQSREKPDVQYADDDIPEGQSKRVKDEDVSSHQFR